MSTLNETIKDIDSKKKQLQETVDSLNDQVEMLKMEGMYCNILNITKIDKVRGYRHQLLQTLTNTMMMDSFNGEVEMFNMERT